MTRNEALACIEPKDWMRARTVQPNRINAMFDVIKDTRKLIGRTLAFYYTYKFIYVSAPDRDRILRHLNWIFNNLNRDRILDLSTIDALRNMTADEVRNYVTDPDLRRWFDEGNPTIRRGFFTESRKLGESLLLSKEQLDNKLQELKFEFPEKFKGVSDEELLNNFKGISIDYLDGCTDLEFKDDDEPEGTIIDITGNSTDILNQPAYKNLMSKVFENIVDEWLEDHNLTHKDIVSFEYDADTQQMFITFDANEIDFNNDEDIEVYQEEDPEETEELEEEFTREALTGLENQLWRKLREKGLFPEDLFLETDLQDSNKLGLTVLIDGDWKHEHLFTEKTIETFAYEHDWKILNHNQESVKQLSNEGDDSYQAFHYYVFEVPEKEPQVIWTNKLQPRMSEDLVNEENIDETYSDEELDKLVGKTFNQQKIQNIYRRVKYNDSRLFAHTRCVNCGREKRVFLSNLINDPDKYGSCVCSNTNVESRLDNIEDLFDGSKRLSNNTSGYTGVSYVKTYKGELYDKWRAYIEVDGKRTYLGDFDSKSAAIRARKKAAEKGIKWYKEHRNEFMKNYRKKSKKYRTARKSKRAFNI